MTLYRSTFTAPLALAAAVALSQPHVSTPAAAASPFNQLGGVWSGSGRLRLSNGDSERVRCRAYYSPRAGGTRMGMAIRCASSSYSFELRSSLAASGSRVTGRWEERNFNANGSLVGTVRSGSLSLAVNGTVRGHMNVSFGANRQTVSLRAYNEGGIRGLSIALRRR